VKSGRLDFLLVGVLARVDGDPPAALGQRHHAVQHNQDVPHGRRREAPLVAPARLEVLDLPGRDAVQRRVGAEAGQQVGSRDAA
jgi:hypothetical protein